jgi:hypothetical protein
VSPTASSSFSASVPGAKRIQSCIGRPLETSVLTNNVKSLLTGTAAQNTAYNITLKWAGFSSNNQAGASLEVGFFGGNPVGILSNPRVRIFAVQLEPGVGSGITNLVFALKAPNSGSGVGDVQIGTQDTSSSGALPSETAIINNLNTITLSAVQVWWRFQIRIALQSSSSLAYTLTATDVGGTTTTATGTMTGLTLTAFGATERGWLRVGARTDTNAFIDELWFTNNFAYSVSDSMKYASCLVSATPSPPPPSPPPPVGGS